MSRAFLLQFLLCDIKAMKEAATTDQRDSDWDRLGRRTTPPKNAVRNAVNPPREQPLTAFSHRRERHHVRQPTSPILLGRRRYAHGPSPTGSGTASLAAASPTLLTGHGQAHRQDDAPVDSAVLPRSRRPAGAFHSRNGASCLLMPARGYEDASHCAHSDCETLVEPLWRGF